MGIGYDHYHPQLKIQPPHGEPIQYILHDEQIIVQNNKIVCFGQLGKFKLKISPKLKLRISFLIPDIILHVGDTPMMIVDIHNSSLLKKFKRMIKDIEFPKTYVGFGSIVKMKESREQYPSLFNSLDNIVHELNALFQKGKISLVLS